MSALESENVKLEYEFCQSKTIPEFDKHRIAGVAGAGVCTVCATDWLLAKMEDKVFVFSQQTIWEKARQIQEVLNSGRFDPEALYKNPLASKLQPNTKAETSFESDEDKGGKKIANLLDKHGHLIIRLSGKIGEGSHALALFKKARGKYYMFDPNFGSYEASKKDGVADWWKELVAYVRPGKGSYKNILGYTDVFPFDKKKK